MPAHDAYLRLTPFERLLPDADFVGSAFEGIRSEMERHPEAGEDPGAFALLEGSRRALAELRDPESGSDDHGATHALLLFHAFHLHEAGSPHLLVTVPVSRWAVEGALEGADGSAGREAAGAGSGEDPPVQLEEQGDGASPGDGLPRAAYVQLPQHLFWFRDEDEGRPSSLDGFFWTVRGETVYVLGVGGLQGPAGEGFRVLPLPGVPRADAPVWLQETMRESGEDFRSDIPGAELEGLYELRTAGELLKLAARIDRFVSRFADEHAFSGSPAEQGEDRGGPPSPPTDVDTAPVGPQAGNQPYTRLTL